MNGRLLLARAIVACALPLSSLAAVAFGPPVTLPAGNQPRVIAVGCVNPGAHPDVLAFRGDGTLAVHLGDGELGFGAPIISSVGAASSAALGGFDAGDDIDLAVTTGVGGTAEFFRGNGDGTFTSFGSTFSAPCRTSGVALADLDRDGDLDAVVGSDQCSEMWILHGDGAGHVTFDRAIRPYDSPAGPVVSDLNGDEWPDIVFIDRDPDWRIVTLHGDGTGGWIEAGSQPLPADGGRLTLADLDHDSRPEIVTTNWWGDRLFMLPGAPGGAFGPARSIELEGVYPIGTDVADFNCDGHPDIAVAMLLSGTVEILEGNGALEFVSADPAPSLAMPLARAVVAADLNGDGAADIVASEEANAGRVRVFGGAPCDSDADGLYDGQDNCPDVANGDQADHDGDGQGDACDQDDDGDGVPDTGDNCRFLANADQNDTDADGAGDACDSDDDGDGTVDGDDNCPWTPNPGQADLDQDGLGDACDSDPDGDGVSGTGDSCPLVPNPDQTDTDDDGTGDDCDPDDDDDHVCDTDAAVPGSCEAGPDNCPTDANPAQADLESDGIGDICDADIDGDGIDNLQDNCPLAANPGNDDADGDGAGDACDADDDGDSVADPEDNCPLVPNPAQVDTDSDGAGDSCDADLDGDGVGNESDNCPEVPNGAQADFDADSAGDSCDDDIDGDGVGNDTDACAGTPAGETVDPAAGCSIAQTCPCSGPRGTVSSWRNHGKHVSCVAHAAARFVVLGLITEDEKDAVVSAAGQSDCGR